MPDAELSLDALTANLPPPLMGYDPAAIRHAAGAWLERLRTLIAGGELNANMLLVPSLIADTELRDAGVPRVEDVYDDVARDAVSAYAWFTLGAVCAASAVNMPEDVTLSPEFLTDPRNDRISQGVMLAAALSLNEPAAAPMTFRYADPADEPVPPGMIEAAEHRTGRRVFMPPAFAGTLDLDDPAIDGQISSFVDGLAADLEAAGVPTANRSEPAMAARAARYERENNDLKVTIATLARLINAASEADTDTAGQVLAGLVAQERDRGYRLAGELFAALAAHYPSQLVRDGSDIDGWPLWYLDTPAGQISHHFSPDDTDLLEHVISVHGVTAGEIWDGHTPADRSARLMALATGKHPDLVRDLIARGMTVTIGNRAGEPCSNDPDCPEPGTPDYYEVEITNSDGVVVAAGESEDSYLAALASMRWEREFDPRAYEHLSEEEKAARRDKIAKLGGVEWAGSQEPPF